MESYGFCTDISAPKRRKVNKETRSHSETKEFAMKKIVLGLILVLGCSGVVTSENRYPLSTHWGTSNERFIRAVILQDNETEQQYIVAYSSHGVAITPRLPGK